VVSYRGMGHHPASQGCLFACARGSRKEGAVRSGGSFPVGVSGGKTLCPFRLTVSTKRRTQESGPNSGVSGG
jgi:hypothetical protein